MSRILRNKKIITLSLIGTIVLIGIFTPFWYIFVIVLSALLIYIANWIVLYSHYNTLQILHNRSKIVNYKINTLIIGDTCNSNILNKYIKGKSLIITTPGRSLYASYQIFLHVESILEEDARLIIVNSSKSRKITIHDLFYLNPITKKELGIEYLQRKSKYPLIYTPLTSIKILLNCKKSKYKEAQCPNKELIKFCNERNIDLIYLSK